MIMPIAADWH